MKTSSQPTVVSLTFDILEHHVDIQDSGEVHLTKEGRRTLNDAALKGSTRLLEKLDEEKSKNVIFYKIFVRRFDDGDISHGGIIYEMIKNSIDAYLDKPGRDLSKPVEVVFTFSAVGLHEENILVNVSDNGCGFPNEESKTSNKQKLPEGARLGGQKKGVKNMINLVMEKDGGLFMQENNVSGGASISMSVPVSALVQFKTSVENWEEEIEKAREHFVSTEQDEEEESSKFKPIAEFKEEKYAEITEISLPFSSNLSVGLAGLSVERDEDEAIEIEPEPEFNIKDDEEREGDEEDISQSILQLPIPDQDEPKSPLVMQSIFAAKEIESPRTLASDTACEFRGRHSLVNL